eukprot:TRINITY_DN1506_c0_g1_i1.p1 TRINITY_DN1506_c0_g1~~TRINITY_DN1506_c0_g1_i1.p1  ORF type:complete len:167 (-),score=24.19 TRINITY_DN1506_c0_g1_i1:144-644(-)
MKNEEPTYCGLAHVALLTPTVQGLVSVILGVSTQSTGAGIPRTWGDMNSETVSSTASLNIPQRGDNWRPNLLSQTPSGQHFWTMTPGGTRLTWTKDQLLHLSHSPLSKSPLDLPLEVSFLSKGAPLPATPSRATSSDEADTDTRTGRANSSPEGENDDDLFMMDSI